MPERIVDANIVDANIVDANIVDANIEDASAEGSSAVTTFLESIRTRQRQARYPQLLAQLATTSPLVFRHREHSDLVVVAAVHHQLDDDLRRAIGQYRFDHSILCGFYDAQYVLAHGITSDPALDAFPSEGIHILVGAGDGRLLAYVCLLPSPDGGATYLMDDPARPLYHVERETFGREAYQSLPALARLPVEQVREFTSLLRNQVDPSPLSTIAVAEALLTMVQVQLHPLCATTASLGCARLEARRAAQRIGIPLLYAPFAPVVAHDLPPYWTPGADMPGLFWPFVAATEDLQAFQGHFRLIDAILAGPPAQVGAGIQALAAARQPTPFALVPEGASADDAAGVIWTTNPYHGLALDRRDVREPAPAARGTGSHG